MSKNIKYGKHIVFLVGLVITILSILFVVLLNTVWINSENNVVWRVFNSIFIASIPVGIISIVFGFFDRLSYAKHELSQVLYENEGYLLYDIDTQRDIKNKIEQNLYFKDVNDPNSLYSIVQKEIISIVHNTYIDEYIINVDCKIVNNMIEKKVHERIIYMNPNLKEKKKKKILLSEVLSTRVFQQDNEEICDDHTSTEKCNSCSFCCLRDVQLWINGVSHLVSVNVETDSRNDTQLPQYSTKFILTAQDKDSITIFEEPVVVDIKYVTKVPLSDNIYVHKIKRATRNYTMHFNFDPMQLDIIPVGYGFMDGDKVGKRVLIEHYETSKKIRFKDWILPGDGVFLTINKK